MATKKEEVIERLTNPKFTYPAINKLYDKYDIQYYQESKNRNKYRDGFVKAYYHAKQVLFDTIEKEWKAFGDLYERELRDKYDEILQKAFDDYRKEYNKENGFEN